MTAIFGDSAGQFASVAAQTLGWSPQEFWGATPSELAMSLRDPFSEHTAGPSREHIAQMMERERHG